MNDDKTKPEWTLEANGFAGWRLKRRAKLVMDAVRCYEPDDFMALVAAANRLVSTPTDSDLRHALYGFADSPAEKVARIRALFTEREAPSVEPKCAFRYPPEMPGGGVCGWLKREHPNKLGCDHAFVRPSEAKCAFIRQNGYRCENPSDEHEGDDHAFVPSAASESAEKPKCAGDCDEGYGPCAVCIQAREDRETLCAKRECDHTPGFHRVSEHAAYMKHYPAPEEQPQGPTLTERLNPHVRAAIYAIGIEMTEGDGKFDAPRVVRLAQKSLPDYLGFEADALARGDRA